MKHMGDVLRKTEEMRIKREKIAAKNARAKIVEENKDLFARIDQWLINYVDTNVTAGKVHFWIDSENNVVLEAREFMPFDAVCAYRLGFRVESELMEIYCEESDLNYNYGEDSCLYISWK